MFSGQKPGTKGTAKRDLPCQGPAWHGTRDSVGGFRDDANSNTGNQTCGSLFEELQVLPVLNQERTAV
jgi:hypothetical protein